MELLFRDLNSDLVDTMSEVFSDCKNVTIECSNIFSGDINVDAIISPANCLGRMDGGIDGIYVNYFGWQLQARLSHHLIENCGDKDVDGMSGRIEIGNATIISTGHKNIKNMIMAPTMDWPPGNVSTTQNSYLAFSAALKLAKELELSSLLCPGLATLTGCMSSLNCARQMRQAWDEII